MQRAGEVDDVFGQTAAACGIGEAPALDDPAPANDFEAPSLSVHSMRATQELRKVCIGVLPKRRSTARG